MNIRKLIQEELKKVFEQEDREIKGLDILNYFPFSELPETRSGADWQNGVPGWGTVNVPSLDTSDAQQQIASKQDFVYHEFQGPKMMHKFDGYIDIFKKKFGEEPVFRIHPDAPWYGKVEILNPKFKEWKDRGNDTKASMLAHWGTTD
jgi:hypothetical protein